LALALERPLPTVLPAAAEVLTSVSPELTTSLPSRQ
jgi:hypothetical protein